MPRHAVFGCCPPLASGASMRILVYGDSLTAGYPDFDEPYAKALVAKCALAGFTIEVVGCGMVGFTAREMVQHMNDKGVNDVCGRTGVGLQKLLQDEILDEGAFDLVLLMAGTNDISEGIHDAGEILRNLQRLHEACHSLGTATVALSIPDFWRQAPDARRNTWTGANEQLKTWARASSNASVHFVDTAQLLPYNKYSVARGAWESDGIHFSEAGSVRFGDALAEELIRIISGSGERWLPAIPVPHTELPKAVAKEVPRAEKTQLLVLGNSVAGGAGTSETGKGWPDSLAEICASMSVDVHKTILEASTVSTWQGWLCDATEEHLQKNDIVLLCISPCDEGMASCSEQDVEEWMETFCEGLQLLVFMLRGKIRPDTRLVLGGPYPNNNYSEMHFRALEQCKAAMASWEEVDRVVDFLQPCVHNGQGQWADGCAADAEHPNDAGHDAMCRCIDLLWDLGLTTEPLR